MTKTIEAATDAVNDYIMDNCPDDALYLGFNDTPYELPYYVEYRNHDETIFPECARHLYVVVPWTDETHIYLASEVDKDDAKIVASYNC